MITQSYKIQDSSSNLMSFLVDDLLDFAQINNGKFRKVAKEFDLKEAVEEVIQIQKEKAKMQGIKLKARFKPQNPDRIISMFNQKVEEIYQNAKGDEIDYETQESKKNRLFEHIDFTDKLDPEERIIVKTDKRRL